MFWIVIGLVIVAMIAIILIAKSSKTQGTLPTKYPYRKLDVLFSPAERSFLGALNKAIGNDAQIFGKVRVADVIAPNNGMSRSDRQKAFNKISGKHFDFLLCDKSDLSVLCAVELNDSSHNSKKRKERDAFLEGVCQSAKVPLVQITARSTYNINEIRQSVAAHLPGNMPPDSMQEPEEAIIELQPSHVV